MATVALTALAMLAFAGNSILCRMALGYGLIDAASFTSIRAASGAIVLALIALASHRPLKPRRSDWASATMLFLYMACFAFAYLWLSAGTGALILFGAVQLTMILYAVRCGEHLAAASWLGIGLAVAGLVWLLFPGLTAPSPMGAVLMLGAGVAWGAYSLIGRSSGDPVASTARNFVLCAPLALALNLAVAASASGSAAGVGLAAASGAITSGLGYVVWYAVLPRLSAAKAASVQLTVPLIAAMIGVVLLGEDLSSRLILASAAILGGVGIVVAQRAARVGRSGSRGTPV